MTNTNAEHLTRLLNTKTVLTYQIQEPDETVDGRWKTVAKVYQGAHWDQEIKDQLVALEDDHGKMPRRVILVESREVQVAFIA
jgi:hypothetical protein